MLARREFAAACDHYTLVIAKERNNLDAYIGASTCLLETGNIDATLSILQAAEERFGDHEVILGLATRCKLHTQDWADIEKYWIRWQISYSGSPTMGFYQTSGEILNTFVKSGYTSGYYLESLLSALVFQDDRSIDTKSHPVICSLLFHAHEYDRPHYMILHGVIKSFVDKRKAECQHNGTLCTAALLLFAGLVSTEERRYLLSEYHCKFDLYSHWSFILIGSRWYPAWDASIQSNVASLDLTRELLRNASKNLEKYAAEQVYKLLFIANVCCREVTPILIEHTRKLLDHDQKGGAVGQDLRFCLQNYKEPTVVQTVKEARPLKIAVCVSGQLRGWKQALRSWGLIGLADHDVTYIVHTWRDLGADSPIPPKDERVFPHSFYTEFRAVWNQFGQNEMLSRYPTFFSLWSNNGAEADLDTLKSTYRTEHVVIEDDSTEPFRRMSNAEKMYYKIWACQEYADKLDAGFDLILRIRPDLEFITQSSIDWQECYAISARQKVLFCESYSTYFFPHIGFAMPDTFALAVPDVMRGYSRAYPMTQRHSGGNRFHLEGFPSDFIAHKNVAYSTLYHGISVDAIFPFAFCSRFSPASKPSLTRMLNSLYLDAQVRNDSFDKALIQALAKVQKDMLASYR